MRSDLNAPFGKESCQRKLTEELYSLTERQRDTSLYKPFTREAVLRRHYRQSRAYVRSYFEGNQEDL